MTIADQALNVWSYHQEVSSAPPLEPELWALGPGVEPSSQPLFSDT